MNSLTEKIAAQIGESLYLGEFCFDQNKFKPVRGQWAELADLVLWLGTHVCVIQIKERDRGAATDENAMRRWFNSAVTGKAVSQLRDTHRFLRRNRDKSVKNRRGDVFPIEVFASCTVVNVVVYSSPCALPADVARHKLLQDQEVGVIHLVDVNSLASIMERVGTPAEFIGYMTFREQHLRAVPDHTCESEKWLFGRYLVSPEVVSVSYDVGDHDLETEVDDLIDDSASLDLRPYLGSLSRLITESLGPRNQYYQILLEIGWLPRGLMREFKKRFDYCLDNVNKGVTNKRPYRIVNERRDCVHVFVMSSNVATALRQKELAGYTTLAKYDRKSRRALGVLVARNDDGEHLHVDWLLEDWPWVRDEKIENMLKKDYPFRALERKARYSYFLKQREEA